MNLRSAATLAATLILSTSSSAAPPTAGETRLTVVLDNFDFAPATIELASNRPYALELNNVGSGGHNFVAPAFFAAAQLDPRSRAFVSKGGVEVAKGQTITVRFLTPAPGRYPLRCTHFLHASFGMKGAIVVR